MAPDVRRGAAESWASAWSHRGTTLVLAIIACAVTIVVLLSAGRAAAVEQQVLAQVETAKPRLITVTILDTHPGIRADAIKRLQGVQGAEWVLALGPPIDVRNTVQAAGKPVAQRELLSPLPAEVTIQPGRAPDAGEAVIGRAAQQQLAMAHPAGTVVTDGQVTTVIGGFTSHGALDDLERLSLVIPHNPDDALATLLYVLADDAANVELVSRSIAAVIGVGEADLQVSTADELIALGDVVTGTVGSFGRQIALGTIAAGMLLIGLSMTLALVSRRRDFGRRRALGATRSTLVALTLAEAGIPVLLGAAMGTAAGAAAIAITAGTLPPLLFATGAFVLITITGTASAAIPAVIAARYDPLKILRVP